MHACVHTDVPALKGSYKVPVALPAAGTPVILGIRPEHITISRPGETLSVELTEALGGVSYDYMEADTGEKIIVEERGDERSKEGTKVGVCFDLQRAMLFDRESEQRIR